MAETPVNITLARLEPIFLRFKESPILRIRETYFQKPTHRPNNFWNFGGKPPFWAQLLRRLNGTNSNVIFWSILGLNGIVFATWSYAQSSAARFGDPKLLLWMYGNFTSSWHNLREGRYWTLLTACFLHKNAGHLLFNGIAFWFFAPPMLTLLTNAQFLALYLGGGIFASAFSLAWNKMRDKTRVVSVGASGAIYSMLVFYACHSPRSKVLLYFFIPMPVWALVSGIFAYDLWGAMSNKQDHSTDSAGHIGGMLSGILFWLKMTGRLRFP